MYLKLCNCAEGRYFDVHFMGAMWVRQRSIEFYGTAANVCHPFIGGTVGFIEALYGCLFRSLGLEGTGVSVYQL